MSTPTDSSQDELRALRERAYGPDADIHDDPVALARLQELQIQDQAARAAARAAVPSSRAAGAGPADDASDARATDAASRGESLDRGFGAATSTSTLSVPGALRTPGTDADPLTTPDPEDGPAGTPSGASDPAAPSDGEDALDPDESGQARPRPWWRRRIPVLWAASVLAGVLVGVGLTLGTQAIEAGRIAVLQEDTAAEWPEEWFGSQQGGRVFDEFHGLTVLVFPQSFGPDGTQTCLYVVTDQGGGFGAGSCGAGSYPAIASMEVGRLSPDELRDAFPDGTALQFVHEGSTVNVYAKAPSLVEPTP